MNIVLRILGCKDVDCASVDIVLFIFACSYCGVEVGCESGL